MSPAEFMIEVRCQRQAGVDFVLVGHRHFLQVRSVVIVLIGVLRCGIGKRSKQIGLVVQYQPVVNARCGQPVADIVLKAVHVGFPVRRVHAHVTGDTSRPVDAPDSECSGFFRRKVHFQRQIHIGGQPRDLRHQSLQQADGGIPEIGQVSGPFPFHKRPFEGKINPLAANLECIFPFILVSRPQPHVEHTGNGIAVFCRKSAGEKIGVCQHVDAEHGVDTTSREQPGQMVWCRDFDTFETP